MIYVIFSRDLNLKTTTFSFILHQQLLNRFLYFYFYFLNVIISSTFTFWLQGRLIILRPKTMSDTLLSAENFIWTSLYGVSKWQTVTCATKATTASIFPRLSMDRLRTKYSETAASRHAQTSQWTRRLSGSGSLSPSLFWWQSSGTFWLSCLWCAINIFRQSPTSLLST